MNDSPGHRGAGTLYIVATPIGNLKDMTFRAIETLNTVDIIAAEDTRHTRKLLSHFQIKSRLVSCHEHNETFRIPMLLEHLQSGMSVALVSDAGTPSVSDPGYRLATAAIAQGIRVVPIPGASAAISALSASGCRRIRFFSQDFCRQPHQSAGLSLRKFQKYPPP
jgi:16S rRNA (cytidine1402-2'-O)-methyltransferase